MVKCLKMPAVSRTLAVLVAASVAAPLPAQTPVPATPPTRINIVILDGEGAINSTRQRVAREPIVQVEDENHKPVAGAAVTFFLPGDGASGVFPNGSRSITMLTDDQGKAVARGIHTNKLAGKMQIRVEASFQGVTSNAVISQTTLLGAAATGGLISGKLLTILLVSAAAAAGGGYAIASNTGGGAKTPASVAVTAGTPTVGPPK